MVDTLTGLSREVAELADLPRPAATVAEAQGSDAIVLDLARRVEAFAAGEPRLDPETHTRLLVRCARTLDPRCPADLGWARESLGCTCSTWWIDPYTGREYDQGGGDRERRYSLDPACPLHGKK